MKTSKRITDFTHYAPFLKERFLLMKSEKPQFSYAYCARKMGSTTSYLKHVFEGRRKIGLSRVSKITSVFCLDDFETQYFTILVIRELTKDAKTRVYLSQVLQRLSFENREMGTFQQFQNVDSTTLPISNWLYGTLIELMNFSDFKDDDTWISSKLIDGPKLKAGEIRAAIDDMLTRKIIEKKGGSYILVANALSVPNSFDGDAFKVYRGIVGKTWDVLGEPATYAKNHFFEAIASVSAEDEVAIFQAAGEYRDKVMNIAQKTKNPSRVLVISNNLFNLAKK